MKRYAVGTLRCPIDGGLLSLHAFSERSIDLDGSARERCARLGIDPAEAATAVEEGVLVSSGGVWYPIINFVPILLDFTTPLHEEFAERHRGKDPLRAHEPPSRQPRPGEIWVQRTFTTEWDLLGLDTISFGYSADARDAFVELELDWPPGLMESTPRILEIGCGSGFESASLDRVARGVVFGVDVNLALLGKGHRLAELPFVNDSIASLFALPMPPKHFDLVYSNGVLHHTHSTREAFDSIVPHARQGGAVYVWLYSNEDYDDTIGKRANWTTEELVRPRIARLPGRLQQAVVSMLTRRHYRVYSRHGTLGRGSWTYEDSEHSVRDRWTPLFAHRHPFKQIIAWFRRCGMDYRPIDPTVYEDRMRIPLIGVGLRGVMPESEPRSALLLLSDASACARASAAAVTLAADGWSVEIAAPAAAAAILDVPDDVRVTRADACPFLGELPNPPALAALRRIPWGRIAPHYESLVASASSAARTVLVAYDLPALAAAAVGATLHGTCLAYDADESFAERPQFRAGGLEGLLLDVERWLAPYADVTVGASPATADLAAVRSNASAEDSPPPLAPEARAEQLVRLLDETANDDPHATDATVVAAVRSCGERLAAEHATTLGIVADLSFLSGRALAKELARRASRRAARGTVRRTRAILSAVSPSAEERAPSK